MATAVQVISVEKDHSFSLNEKALKMILHDPRVKDSEVIVLSIAGAYRTGKSFLLNFFLRYLYQKGSENWMGDANVPLKGFDWRGGSERHTTGILMWSEPLELSLPNGQKAFVLLMDTQGMFDSASPVKECSTIFALSTMVSSIQIYNIMSNIQEDDLQHLQYFTAYGRLALDKGQLKPFQDLYFLVRDWQFIDDYKYGLEGGEQLLAKRLETKDDQHSDLKELREHLRSCFSKIGCCLMPHPGKKVATRKNFDGRLSDIEKDFTVEVQEFVSSLLSPNKVVFKEIDGRKITGMELFECFKKYVEIFKSKELPEPMTLFNATAEVNNRNAIRKALNHYEKKMDLVCGDDKPYVDSETLPRYDAKYRLEAVKRFQSIPKMGGKKRSGIFRAELDSELQKLYERYKTYNKNKRLSFTKIIKAVSRVAADVASAVAGVVDADFAAGAIVGGIASGSITGAVAVGAVCVEAPAGVVAAVAVVGGVATCIVACVAGLVYMLVRKRKQSQMDKMK